MSNLEKQLNNLPKKKLSMRVDYALRFKLYKAMRQKKVDMYVQYFSFKRHLSPLIAVLVLISLIVGVPGYAYANENVTAVHYLYVVKKAVEKIEFVFAFSEEDKQRKQEKFITRRLNEAEILSQNIDTEEHDLALVETINEAMELRKEIKIIEKQENKQIQTLTQIANTVGIKAEDEVLDAVAEALEMVEKAQPNKEKKKILIINRARNCKIMSIEQTINIIQDEIEKLNDNLENNGYRNEDVQILNKRLQKKIEKAKDAVEKNNINAANAIINTATALTNNAKHFLKEKKNNNSKPAKSNKKK